MVGLEFLFLARIGDFSRGPARVAEVSFKLNGFGSRVGVTIPDVASSLVPGEIGRSSLMFFYLFTCRITALDFLAGVFFGF